MQDYRQFDIYHILYNIKQLEFNEFFFFKTILL